MDLWILWLAFASAAALTFASTVDDPFITLRYAHNILSGSGAVFNPGQRVNAATSPAGLVLALVALILPGGYSILKLKLLSVLFGGLTVGWSKKLVDGLRLPVFLRRGALFLIGVSPIVGFASASGLETTLEAFALVGLVVELRSGRAFVSPWRAALFGVVVTASRPEGVLLLVAVLTVACMVERPLGFMARVRWAIPGLATAAAIFTADHFYYGSALPNTYYAKHVPLGQAISGGYGYLLHGWELGYTSTSVGRLLLSNALAILADSILLGGLVFACVRFRQLAYLGAVCLTTIVFVLASGGDWIQGSRFLLPAVPFLIILAACAMSAAPRGITRSGTLSGVLLALLGLTTLFPYVPAVASAAGPVWELRGFSDREVVASGGYVFSKIWADSPQLLSCVPKGGVVAVTEAGYLGFARPDLRILDLRGLASREVAMSAPPTARRYYGIQDPNWAFPTSAIGKIILRSRPDAIATIDPFNGSPFGGEYRVVAVDSAPEVTLTLYGRVGGPCQPPLSH